MPESKPYKEADEGYLEVSADNLDTLPISQEIGGELARSQPSAIESIDALIAEQKSPEAVEKYLDLRERALVQKAKEAELDEIRKQRAYQRATSDRQEITITTASLGTTAIGIGIMYTLSPLVGTFILILGTATLLRIPFDEAIDKFLDFYGATVEKVSDVFSSEP